MTLQEVIAAAKAQLASSPSKPVMIMVVGGSATGKSTQVLPALLAEFGDDALLVEQDWYQLGARFAEKDESPYKWDDPRNFQISALTADLRKLQDGESVTAPSFDVVAVDSVGERLLEPRKVIIVDGIYTLHDELKDLADYGVYVSMPFYGRFLRRLFRMLYDQKQDKPQTAFKQVFGSVLRAHRDFVSQQADAADCIIEAPYSFAETIDRYDLSPNDTVVPATARQLWEHESLGFYVNEEDEGSRFYIVYDGAVYYDFRISSEYTPLLADIDYDAS